ncbi:MAG: malate dehydrogenase (oxaloacetate-decarboxylating), partial [Glaciecola sp.]
MASYTQRVTLRLAIENAPGMLGTVTEVIENAGADVNGTTRVDGQRHVVFRDITIEVRDDAHAEEVAAALTEIEGVEVLALNDDVIAAHLGGKIEIRNKIAVNDARDLALVYTPGVARICRAIAEDPTAAYRLTIKSNSVAIVTDGTAVLGLGDIG